LQDDKGGEYMSAEFLKFTVMNVALKEGIPLEIALSRMV
jgi:hypothetical protein